MIANIFKAALVVVACAAIGALALPGPAAPAAAPVPKQETDPVKLELARLQGTWRLVGGEYDEKKFSAEDVKKAGLTWEIKGQEITWRNAVNQDGFQTAFKNDPSKKPKEFDLGPIHIKGKPQNNPLGNPRANMDGPGIYELQGDTLRVCYGGGGENGKERPKEFKTIRRVFPDNPLVPIPPQDPHERILVFERVKEKEPGK